MTLFYLEVDLHLPEAHSLKEKRMPLESLKAGLKNHFNISLLEIGDRSKWQRATLALTGLAGTDAQADQIMDKLISYIDRTWVGEALVQDRLYLL
ncbi:DUF503 domain-containing protein [Peptococcus simiae]|uniref:DUF503 domain-containing protein n=1 Tax=Peptococcus simiae TaxID=1643805 RepID=A0ABW9H097_9FIRM